MHEEEVERVAGEVAGAAGEPGAVHPIVITGGESRVATRSASALAEVPASAELVAVHDAARPLVTAELVDGAGRRRLAAEPDAAGVIAAAPVDRHGQAGCEDGPTIAATEPRAPALWAAQTPQVFRAAALRDAHDADRRASPRRPTTRCWSRRPAAGSWSSRRRPRT